MSYYFGFEYKTGKKYKYLCVHAIFINISKTKFFHHLKQICSYNLLFLFSRAPLTHSHCSRWTAEMRELFWFFLKYKYFCFSLCAPFLLTEFSAHFMLKNITSKKTFGVLRYFSCAGFHSTFTRSYFKHSFVQKQK